MPARSGCRPGGHPPRASAADARVGLIALLGLGAPRTRWPTTAPCGRSRAGRIPRASGCPRRAGRHGGARLTTPRPANGRGRHGRLRRVGSAPLTEDASGPPSSAGPASLNAFEQEQSFGAIAFAGKLRADGDISAGTRSRRGPRRAIPTPGCPAPSRGRGAGVDLTGYQHRIYVFPRVAACAWSGAADMPGTDSFINGSLAVRVLAHELGHNMGAEHASTLRCMDGGVPVRFAATCTQSEYGDPFDVMGSAIAIPPRSARSSRASWPPRLPRP